MRCTWLKGFSDFRVAMLGRHTHIHEPFLLKEAWGVVFSSDAAYSCLWHPAHSGLAGTDRCLGSGRGIFLGGEGSAAFLIYLSKESYIFSGTSGRIFLSRASIRARDSEGVRPGGQVSRPKRFSGVVSRDQPQPYSRPWRSWG